MQLCDSFNARLYQVLLTKNLQMCLTLHLLSELFTWISVLAASLNADVCFVRTLTHLPPQLQYFVNVYIANIKVLKKKMLVY